MGTHLQIGLVGASTPVLDACRDALACVGRGVLVTDVASTEALSELDMLLLVVEPPHVEGVRRFGRMREVAPQLPVLVLARGLDVDHAVELVKFGAVDLLELPASKRALARKIERALRGTTSLTIESPVLAPLAAITRSVSFSNNRSCFRARVPERLAVRVIVSGINAAMRATLVDLSLPSDDGPAGVCVLVDLVAPTSSARGMTGASLQLFIEAFGRIVVATACVRRCELVEGAPPSLRLGMTITVSSASDEALLQRIWVESQRRESVVPAAPSGRASSPPPRASSPPPRASSPPPRTSSPPPRASVVPGRELSTKKP